MENVKLNTIEEAIEDFKAGNFVIVVDDEEWVVKNSNISKDGYPDLCDKKMF